MADINWSPSSDLSSFYMGRMAPPIKLPDGTYIPTPNVLSVDQIYQGILPPSVPSTPLVSRSVNTVPVDSSGNPIVPRVGNNIPPVSETLAEQRSGWRPAVTQGVQPAGTVTMPPGARPSNIPLPSMPPPSTLSAAWDPFNTINENADQSRLPPSDGGEAGFMAAFYPGAAQNPALGAIDGSMPPMPRQRPVPPAQMPLTSILAPTPRQQPLPPASIPLTSVGSVGNVAPPSVPVPRLRASPETFAKNRAAAEAALAIDMAGGSTHKTGKYAKATPRKDRLAARDGKQR